MLLRQALQLNRTATRKVITCSKKVWCNNSGYKLAAPTFHCKFATATSGEGVKRSKKKKKKNMDEAEKDFKKGKIPAPDSTSMFRLTNPELFLDVNKKSTWRIVYTVWFFCLGTLAYKYYEDYAAEYEVPPEMVGPMRKDGKWKSDNI